MFFIRRFRGHHPERRDARGKDAQGRNRLPADVQRHPLPGTAPRLRGDHLYGAHQVSTPPQ